MKITKPNTKKDEHNTKQIKYRRKLNLILPPILSACRQPLLPACVFVIRDTVRHPRRFLGKFVREPDFS
jgi:hypothetical protein